MQRSGDGGREAAIVVGTSSWADPGFVEEWYPPDLPARDRLAWYEERFDAVEVNSTFYAIPGSAQVRRWVDVTPDGFLFHVKLHRLLSRHAGGVDSLPPDLRERARTGPRGRVQLDAGVEEALAERLLDAIRPLVAAGRLRCLLLQLTPAFSPREHALDELAPLVARLAPHPVAIELRNRNWARPDRLAGTLGWMEEHGAVWVSVDAPAAEHFTIMPPVDAVTRPGLAYLRLHGRDADAYIRGRSVAERFGWRYSDDELREILGRAHQLAERAGEGGEVHVMANNNRGADAPLAAQRMRQLLGQAQSTP